QPQQNPNGSTGRQQRRQARMNKDPSRQQARSGQSQGNPMQPAPTEQAADKGGGGANSGGRLKDKNADLDNDVWGHGPESLGAEMMAYANAKEFMAKYDELIKKFYRSLAEQGRTKKGD